MQPRNQRIGKPRFQGCDAVIEDAILFVVPCNLIVEGMPRAAVRAIATWVDAMPAAF
jgi:hypothetical protein